MYKKNTHRPPPKFVISEPNIAVTRNSARKSAIPKANLIIHEIIVKNPTTFRNSTVLTNLLLLEVLLNKYSRKLQTKFLLPEIRPKKSITNHSRKSAQRTCTCTEDPKS